METILDYITTFNHDPLHSLIDFRDQYDRWNNIQPPIGELTGALLHWLIQALPVRKALEFGTCLGFSTLYLAHALRRTGGQLTSVEIRADLIDETRKNLQKADLLDVVTLIEGDAVQVIRELAGPYDLILQDSDKALYSLMLDDCVERLRPGGILAADDALFVPMGAPERLAKPVDDYNRRVFADPRLDSIMLPLGDGLVLSIKK